MMTMETVCERQMMQAVEQHPTAPHLLVNVAVDLILIARMLQRAAIGEERKVEVEELKKEIEETRKGVEPSFLSTYDRVTKSVSRPPYMAPINDQKCSGCHLRVSNDVVSSVLVENKITQCDQCGRIVYVER